MRIFDTNKSKTAIKGLIGYHGLANWWLTEFSDEERKHIVSTYNPMGWNGEDALIKANIIYYYDEETGEDINGSVIHFLSFLAGWFDNKRDRHLAIKILEKAEELINDKISITDHHIYYSHKIEIHYHNRIDPNSYKKAVWACEKQIEIASEVSNIFKHLAPDGFMPGHLGYEQLAIIRKKDGKYQEVIDLCSKALKEGWMGDWEKRIEWCKKRLNQ